MSDQQRDIAKNLWGALNGMTAGRDTSVLRQEGRWIENMSKKKITRLYKTSAFREKIKELYLKALNDQLKSGGSYSEALAKYIEELAFFCTDKPPPGQKNSNKPPTKRKSISVATSTVERKAIKDPLRHEVYFESLDLDETLKGTTENRLDLGGEEGFEIEDLASYLHELFFQTLAVKTPSATKRKEQGDLDLFFYSINQNFLELFQNPFEVESMRDSDYIIKRPEKSQKTLIIVEGKDVNCFPLYPLKPGCFSAANLCWLGSAIAVTKKITDDTAYTKMSKALYLQQPSTRKKNPENPGDGSTNSCSLAQYLLDQKRWDDTPQDQDGVVKTQFDDDKIWKQQLSKMIMYTARMLHKELKRTDSYLQYKDPLYLWGATMQACLGCLKERRKVGIVMSTRVMFFIQLVVRGEDTNRKCIIQISDGTQVYSKGFLKLFLRFIEYGSSQKLDSAELKGVDPFGPAIFKTDEEDESNDENGANKESKGDNSQGNGSGGDTDQSGSNSRKRSRPDDGNGNDGQQPGRDHARSSNHHEDVCTLPHDLANSGSTTDECKIKKNNIVSPGPASPDLANSRSTTDLDSQSINMKESMTMTDEEQMAWQRAFVGGNTAHYDKAHRMLCLDIDMSGVITPYICYLEDVVETLGNGRCGEVKKIKWRGGYAALKRFELIDPDDDRCPLDVCEREVKIYYALESLWGKHVPRLLFKCPWSWYPAIGVEVGEPMPDDYDEWSAADLEKKRKTDEAIKGFGYVQMDDRGSNYVRLAGEKIAMIDFEVLEENQK